MEDLAGICLRKINRAIQGCDKTVQTYLAQIREVIPNRDKSSRIKKKNTLETYTDKKIKLGTNFFSERFNHITFTVLAFNDFFKSIKGNINRYKGAIIMMKPGKTGIYLR